MIAADSIYLVARDLGIENLRYEAAQELCAHVEYKLRLLIQVRVSLYMSHFSCTHAPVA